MTSESGPLTHARVLAVLAGVMLGLLLASLDQAIVATALPTIGGELGGIGHLSWVVTAYLLTATAATPIFGKLSDLYGRRPTFQVAIVIFIVGSALCATASSLWALVAFRAVQGVGAGGLLSLAWAIVGDVVPPRERGRYQGYLSAVFATASVAGPLLGGLFVDHLSWRWVFTINIPFGIVAFVVTTVSLKVPFVPTRHKIDLLGALLLVSAVTCALLVAVWGGEEYPWTSAPILLLAIAWAVLGVLFIAQERRAPEPLLPLRLFRDETFVLAVSISVIVGIAVFGLVVYMPLYFQVVRGSSPTVSGLLTAPLLLGIFVLSLISGRIITRWGRYRAFPIAGTVCMALGLATLSFAVVGHQSIAVPISLALVGAGLGMSMHVMMLAAQNAVSKRDLGVTSSAVSCCRSLGSVFGVAYFSAVLNARILDYLDELQRVPGAGDAIDAALHGQPADLDGLPPAARDGVVDVFAHAYQTTLRWCVPIAAVAVVLALRLRDVPLRDSLDEDVGLEAVAVL